MWAVVELGLGFVGTIVLFSALQASRSSDIRMGAGLLGGVFLNDRALPSDLDFAHSLANGGCSREIKRRLLLGRKPWNDKSRQCIRKQRHHFANKGPSSQSYVFSSSHVWM